MNDGITRVVILGSTGSIGTQALDVIARRPDRFKAVGLAAGRNAALLERQALAFSPRALCLADERDAFDFPGEWRFGERGLLDMCALDEADAVLVAVVGMMGLPLVLECIKRGKRVLLANKEPLVAGGALVMEAARAAGVPLLPVDSEHSAIFQCLQTGDTPYALHLTASGGPFRTWDKARIDAATPADALKHPNWAMGAKITVDSATLMNKGLEVIEAYHLFGMPPERINVVIHPQSVIHSMVELVDGALLAQMGAPDMRAPIAYALSYPERVEAGARRLDMAALAALSFERPDTERFPCLRLAYEALRAGGLAPAVLNGANERAVELFLSGAVPLGGIPRLVEGALNAVDTAGTVTLERVYEVDRGARLYVDLEQYVS